MAIKEHHIRVRISKRIQEDQFEPFEILFEEIIVMDRKGDASNIRKTLYNKMEKQIDKLIDNRFEAEE